MILRLNNNLPELHINAASLAWKTVSTTHTLSVYQEADSQYAPGKINDVICEAVLPANSSSTDKFPKISTSH